MRGTEGPHVSLEQQMRKSDFTLESPRSQVVQGRVLAAHEMSSAMEGAVGRVRNKRVLQP